MRIGIISDIHDHIDNLRWALEKLRDVDVIICCGDLCSPFIVDVLGKGFEGPLHVVFGNNDGDRFRIIIKASQYPNLQFHGEFVELALGGKSFAVNHFDNIGEALAKGGQYDVVCYGHNHRYEVRRVGTTLAINPGEIMGGLSDSRESTFVIYDTEKDSVQRVVNDGLRVS